jgi:DMSO reductase family type II enzyme chaperone
MTATIDAKPADQPAVQQQLARARLYEQLARTFREPDAGLVADLQSGRFARELDQALAQLPATRRLRGRLAAELAAAREGARRISPAYGTRFVLSGAGGSPPYEAEYIPIGVFRRMQQMADVAGFYRAFGLEMSPGGGRPDHLAAELEFMASLAFREAYASRAGNAEGATICRRAQRVFLADHLVRWLPSFAERVSETGPGDSYAALARIANAIVTWDARRWRVRARPLDWALASGPSGELPLYTLPDDGCAPCMEDAP